MSKNKKNTNLTKRKVGRPRKPPTVKKLLKELIPTKELFNDEELELYNSLVDIFLNDFDEDELTAGDLDDIMTISMNKVYEIRLLRLCKDNPEQQLDVAQAIEKSRKQTEKIKESLASRRKDRVNPNELKGFSIIDLAAAFDNDKKLALREKIEKMKVEDAVAREKLDEHGGNRYDKEGDI